METNHGQILRFFSNESSGFAVKDRKHQDPPYRKLSENGDEITGKFFVFFLNESSGFAVKDREHQDPTDRKQCPNRSSDGHANVWEDASTLFL